MRHEDIFIDFGKIRQDQGLVTKVVAIPKYSKNKPLAYENSDCSCINYENTKIEGEKLTVTINPEGFEKVKLGGNKTSLRSLTLYYDDGKPFYNINKNNRFLRNEKEFSIVNITVNIVGV